MSKQSEDFVAGYVSAEGRWSLSELEFDCNQIFQEFDQRYINSKKNKKIISDFRLGWLRAVEDHKNGCYNGEEDV